MTPDFERDGWVHARGLVPAAVCDAVREALEPHFDRTGAGRLLNAWEVVPAVRRLATQPEVLDLVTGLLGHEVLAFQTLDFRRGTEQDAHADSLFFDTLPRGRMCGAWVALEDVGPSAGPLRLWPGTHRGAALWGPVDPATAFGPLPEPVDVTVDHGDVVVWAANLLHGGAPVEDPTTTRWSQVTHYVAADHVYLSPLTSEPDDERYMVRDQLVDVATGRRAPQRLDGRRVAFAHGHGGRSRLVVDPSPTARAGLVLRDVVHGAPSTRRRLAASGRRVARRLTARPQAS